MIPAVVGIDFLDEHPDAVVVDVRWYLDGRDGRAAFEAGHLPGARWADLDRELSATGRPSTEGRHPLPDPADFAAAMDVLGIDDRTVVVAYDDSGGLTAGRLVVMLRMLGHDAAVLDGGIAAWTGPLESGPAQRVPGGTGFAPRPWPAERLVTADEVAALAAGAGVVLDARAHERFTGEQALIDPRPGHVPGARSAPSGSVLGPDGRIAPIDQLQAHFARLGVTVEALERGEVATYCGSGVSACMNLVAMEHAGLPPARLYVASWSGWSSDADRPAELGS